MNTPTQAELLAQYNALGLPQIVPSDPFTFTDADKAEFSFVDPLPLVPTIMKRQVAWVTYESKDKKAPIISGTTLPARSNDPNTWVSFQTLSANISQGIGYMNPGFVIDGARTGYLVGVDIDGCWTGSGITERAQAVLDFFKPLGTYAEWTPNQGLHVWFRGSAANQKFLLYETPGYHNKAQKVEVFSDGLYFTMSGKRLPGFVSEVPELSSEQVNELLALLESLEVGEKSSSKGQKLKSELVPGTLQFKAVPVEPDPAFKKLFDEVGWEPFEERVRKMADVRFYNFTLSDKLSFCPMPGHVPRGPEVPFTSKIFGALGDGSVVHCFGCQFGGDMVKAVYTFDAGAEGGKISYGNMYECARVICEERGLNSEEYFPRPKVTTQTVIEVTEDGMPVDPETMHLTETGNARRVIAANGANIRYVSRWDDFLVYDKTRGLWVVDNSNHLVERFMKQMTKQTLRDAEAQIKAYKTQANQIERSMKDEKRPATESELEVLFAYQEARLHHKWALASESNRTIKGSISLIKSEEGMTVEPEDMNKNRWLANVQNGALVFNNDGSVLFRNHLRSDYCDRAMPVVYDPTATCPIWLAFLDQMMVGKQDYIDFLQEYFGFCLTGVILRRILILYGGGLNGKGTLMRTIAKVLGEDREGYAMEASIKLFMTYRETANGSPRPDILELEEPRLVTAFEVNQADHAWDMSILKKITGGDALRARALHSNDEYQFRPKCKIVLGLNHLPKINDSTKAARDRIAVLKCTMSLEPGQVDLTLEPRMAAEASGILNWLIGGLQRALRRRHEGGELISIPAGVLADSLEYVDSENPKVIFAKAYLVQDEAASVNTQEVYECYAEWAQAGGHEVEDIRKFVPYLVERLGYAKKRERSEDGQVHVLKGVRLDRERGKTLTGQR